MDKRRGGCAPNIAYNLALLGERPRLMATAGQDFGEYRPWLEAAGVDTSLVKEVTGKFTASFFCSTDRDHNQIASFYTGAMAHAGELSFREAGGCDLRDHLAERSWRDDPLRRGVPRAGHPLHLRPRPAVRPLDRRRAARGPRGRVHARLQRLRVRADPPEDRPGRGGRPRARRAAGRDEGGEGVDRDLARAATSTSRPCPRTVSRTRPAWATRFAPAS